MVKVVFLLEVAPEWWLIAERTVAFRGRSEVLLRGTGTDVDVRHEAFQRESPRHGVASYATTQNHMIACANKYAACEGMSSHGVVVHFFTCATWQRQLFS